jgi:hypothetical protein
MATITGVRTSALLAAITAALGCTTGSRDIAHDRATTRRVPTSSVARAGALAPVPHRAGDILSASELSSVQALGSATAYDVLMRLRPGFLLPRTDRNGPLGMRGVLPAVFVNGAYYGEVDALRVLSASTIAEVQYVRSLEAQHWYGADYQAGVILIRLRR